MITELQKKMWEEHVARRARMSVKKQKEEPKEPTVAQQEETAVSVDPDPILHYINKVRLIDIQNLVAEKYGITRNDIVSQRRAVKITFPRQIAYWLATETTPMSYDSWDEFHRRNNSEKGPVGLLRHRLDSRCIGHGGTWDLIIGEFS